MASNQINVNVKLSSGRKACYFSIPETTLQVICEKVAKNEGVPRQCIQLKFDGKILRKQHSLSYLGVVPETVLKVVVVTREPMQLKIKQETGDTVPFSCENITTLQELREKLNRSHLIPVNAKVQHYGSQLNYPDQTMKDYDIRDNDTLEVISVHQQQAQQVEIDQVPDLNETEQQEVLASFAAGLTSDTAVEVVFSFDTTGSMYSILNQVKTTLHQTITRLLRDIPNIRIGIMAHGDYCDEHLYVLKKKDLTSDMESLETMVNDVSGSGGEGNFACYEWVLKNANQLSWSQDSAKALVIIGDVVPHAVSYTSEGISWRQELDLLCEKGVKVYGVQAMDFRPATSFYKELARKSGGAYISFQHFHLITDMFLAVCYKESGEEQLDAFHKEAESEGRLTEELSDMLTQLKETNSETDSTDGENEDEQRQPLEEDLYVRTSWWDVSLDMTIEPKFIYNHETAMWCRQSIRHTYNTHQITRVRRNTRKSSGWKKLKCSIM